MSQYNLGDCYEHGNGVLQDETLALYWYTKAANQGETNAQEALQRLTEKRQVPPQNNQQPIIAEQPVQKNENGKSPNYYGLIHKFVMLRRTTVLNSKKVKRLEASFPVTPEQKRLLTLGSPLFCQNLESCRTFKIRANQHDVINMLSSWWGIDDRSEALSTLIDLSSANGHTPFADDVYKNLILDRHIEQVDPDILYAMPGLENAIISTIDRSLNLADIPLIKSEQNRNDFWLFVRTKLAERINEVLGCYRTAKDILLSLGYTEAELSKVKSTIAWDSGRAVSVARYCAHAGYIDESEAWEFMRNASNLVIKLYSGWREYLAGYVFGRALGFNSDSTEIYSAIRYVLTHKNSPFNEVSYNWPFPSK